MFWKLQKQPWLQVAIGAAIVFFIFSLTLMLHRYYTFYASYDQGIFNQVFWNGIHGRFFQSSLSSALSTNVVHAGQIPQVFYHRLGQHFTPALLLWLPLYALFPSPITLIFLQVTLVTTAGLVLYVLARHYLSPHLSTAIVVSFYGANAILGPTLGNFHDISQIPLYTFGLLLALEKRWWWLFSILAVFLLIVREDSGIGLFSIGFYLILSQRYPRLGIALCILSFGYIVALTNLIMPIFSEDISKRFMMERFGQYADGDEASSLEIIWGMISNPLRLLTQLVTPVFGKIKYLVGHWLPLAFVPAFSGTAWMVAGFPLIKLFIAQGDSVLAINIRYAMNVAPGFFYGAIVTWSHHPNLFDSSLRGAIEFLAQQFQAILTKGKIALNFSKINRWWNKHPKLFQISFKNFWMICISLSLAFTLFSNPNRTLSFIIPDSISPWVYVPLTRQWEHSSKIRLLINQIPSDASVSATTYIVPHLSGRREILRFPQNIVLENDAKQAIAVEYIIADIWQLQKYQVAFKQDRELLKTSLSLINDLTKSGQYGIRDFQDGVIFLQRQAASVPAAVAAWNYFVSTSIDEKFLP